MIGWMDVWMNGWMYGWMYGCMDGYCRTTASLISCRCDITIIKTAIINGTSQMFFSFYI